MKIYLNSIHCPWCVLYPTMPTPPSVRANPKQENANKRIHLMIWLTRYLLWIVNNSFIFLQSSTTKTRKARYVLLAHQRWYIRHTNTNNFPLTSKWAPSRNTPLNRWRNSTRHWKTQELRLLPIQLDRSCWYAQESSEELGQRLGEGRSKDCGRRGLRSWKVEQLWRPSRCADVWLLTTNTCSNTPTTRIWWTMLWILCSTINESFLALVLSTRHLRWIWDR